MKRAELIVNKAFINGQWVSGTAGFDVLNPATGELIEKITNLSAEALQHAIKAAHETWQSFKKQMSLFVLAYWKNGTI